MKCPYCASDSNKVIDKRETENAFATRRRRECLDCSKRFTTYERIESIDLTVIKKNSTRDKFDKKKLERSVLIACQKRPVSMDTIREICDSIEHELLNKQSTEVKSQIIGNSVMRRLKKLDKVAYIRFASVYRDFADVEDFQEELGKLIKKGSEKKD